MTPILRLLCSALIRCAGLLLCCVPLEAAAQGATPGIDVGLLRRDLSRLAADSMRGRDTPSPELERALDYIAAEFEAAGIKPLGDRGGFRQRFAITDVAVEPGTGVLMPGGRRLELGRDLLLYFDHHSPSRTTGPLVVLGGNLLDSTAARLNLNGSVLVVVPTLTPEGALPQDFGAALGNAMRSNPHAIVIAADLSDSVTARIRARQSAPARRLDVEPSTIPGGPLYSHSIFLARTATVSPVLAKLGVRLPSPARPNDTLVVLRPPGAAATAVVRHREVARHGAANVIGVVEGSDPRLRGEYVVLSAHADHLGVGQPDTKGDSIYNGADDNASGTTVLLALARALGSGSVRPKRSILLVATSGEERGLWGSDYFASHSPVPLARMIANINIDGVGGPARNDSLATVGGDLSDLGEIVAEIARSRSDLRLTTGDFVPGFFRSSDQISFARRGVPSIQVFSGGLLPYYHTPADQFEVVDFDWLRRVAELVLDGALAVANRDGPPRWRLARVDMGTLPF